jgi:2-polyprenyl-3-methyl-5-hydroxy-6-metoxy-1,4-benzoquinol methylase
MINNNNNLDGQKVLFDILLGPLRWNAIELGFKTQLFDHFRQPNQAHYVASDCGWRTEPLVLLLNAYVSIGLMIKEAQSYRLHPSYIELLYSKSEGYMGDTLCLLVKVKQLPIERAIQWLTQSNNCDCSINLRDPSFWKQAFQRLHTFHISTRNPSLLPLLEALPQWKDGMQLLDVGAGSPELAKTICTQFPSSEVTLFDLPPCCHEMAEHLQSNPWEGNNRVHLLEGDMNDGHFGDSYDLILAAMSLYFAEDLCQCVKQLWQCVKPGGALVCFHETLNEDRTAPSFHIVGRLPAELANGALSLEFGTLEQALSACHPSNLATKVVNTPYGEMAFIVATKPV